MGGPKGIAAMLLTAACGISACAIVDSYGDRAVQYNLEAEQVQDQDILLNVVRASKRRPLEFSGVQTVSGNASATGTVSLSLPIWQNSARTPTTLTPGGTVSGGPTFTVGVLDTQEFYQGMLTPIPMSTIDLFAGRGLSRILLLDLFIRDVRIAQTRNTPITRSLLLQNSPTMLARTKNLANFRKS